MLTVLESDAAALESALAGQADLPHSAELVKLATRVHRGATQTLAALDALWPVPVPAASAVTATDLCHHLLESLGRHQDRLADLTNAGVPVTPGSVSDVAALSRLAERLTGELAASTNAYAYADESPVDTQTWHAQADGRAGGRPYGGPHRRGWFFGPT